MSTMILRNDRNENGELVISRIDKTNNSITRVIIHISGQKVTRDTIKLDNQNIYTHLYDDTIDSDDDMSDIEVKLSNHCYEQYYSKTDAGFLANTLDDLDFKDSDIYLSNITIDDQKCLVSVDNYIDHTGSGIIRLVGHVGFPFKRSLTKISLRYPKMKLSHLINYRDIRKAITPFGMMKESDFDPHEWVMDSSFIVDETKEYWPQITQEYSKIKKKLYDEAMEKKRLDEIKRIQSIEDGKKDKIAMEKTRKMMVKETLKADQDEERRLKNIYGADWERHKRGHVTYYDESSY
jgi:hypothetical protein